MKQVAAWIEHNFQGIAFGLMDGLILLLGLLMGLSEATGEARIVIMGGIIGGIANSFGNAIGFYTSESAERGQQLKFYKGKKTRAAHRFVHSYSDILFSTLAAFGATLVSLALPVLPFFAFESLATAMLSSGAIAIVMLAVLGYFIGKMNESDGWWSSVKYVVLGLVGAGLGFLVGDLLKHSLGG
ncbi:MAG: VIT1/CCC1 transporter family protein [Candidatus Micrarchaeota archaeon]